MERARLHISFTSRTPDPATVDAALRMAAAVAGHLASRWRRELERCITAMGLRAELIHVDEATWSRLYDRGASPHDAVLEVAERFH